MDFDLAWSATSSLVCPKNVGKFADEIQPRTPFNYLCSQCSATVENREPTFFHHRSGAGGAFSRLLLPMWGDGRIGMLLGAVDWH
jgi:hypothetical protein